MHHKAVLFLAAAAVLVSACGAKTPAPAATAAASQPSATAPGAGTSQPAATAPVAATPIDTGCTVVSLVPTPGPTEVSLFPPAAPGDWVRGPQDAAVTFTEYSDFQ